MSNGGTFSKRLSEAADAFWGSVTSGAETFARDVLPVWAAQRLETGKSDKLRQPNFNANVSRPSITAVDPTATRTTFVSGGLRSTTQTSDAPGPQGFFGLSNQQLLLFGGALIVLLAVATPLFRR